LKLTVEPEIEQTELLAASILKVTGLPDPPPVAVTAYVGPETTAELGAVDVNVIVWVLSAASAVAGKQATARVTSASAEKPRALPWRNA
jgi:hypothetical protein